MDSYEILKENYVQFRSLDNKASVLNEAQKKKIEPLFTHILEGLEAHAHKLELTANSLASNKYTPSYRKEQLGHVASEYREEAKKNALLMLERLKSGLLACGTALSTQAMANRVVTDPIEKLTQELRDREIRGDLARIEPSKRINILFDTTKEGDSSVLDALRRGPVTKRTLIPSEELETAEKQYTQKVAPVQVEALEQMKGVVEKGRAAIGLMDSALSYIEQQSGL